MISFRGSSQFGSTSAHIPETIRHLTFKVATVNLCATYKWHSNLLVELKIKQNLEMTNRLANSFLFYNVCSFNFYSGMFDIKIILVSGV